ncbi:phototropic-responsive NPH3 family protein [Tasmannia lanceolata]|uniref:phototropic-responsive NPH3 family protein n=1 Tax=Tasmannia lanceolata TaxID=3420 RepID=UPI004063174D
MKYMKIGTGPDTFYTEEATRSVSSDVPSDLTIQVNNTTYLLHKFPLLPKCGLLQQMCGDSGESLIELHDLPGGEEAFELCAKFCYGITINLSAHNFVLAISAAKFLRMTESVEKDNLVLKLEVFFNSCILQGWKDSIVTLHTTGKLPEWSENLGIVGRCIDAIVEKILTPTSKVTWSYTYTRPGYAKKQHRSIPKDWWTEDVSDLDIDLFRCIIAAVRSAKKLSAPLIGEALHVYASRWLPNISKAMGPESSISRTEESRTKNLRVLESIVSMIPSDRESVTGGFLLRLLKVANLIGPSPSTKAELVRRSGRQLDEATVSDLLFPLRSSTNAELYDIDLVGAILENFFVQFRRRRSPEHGDSMRSIYKVGKLVDLYLQVVARDGNVPASKIASLAESLPENARPVHDELYKAIDIFLKEHPELSKTERKRVCQILDCRKLSTDVCMHALRNERLPLRTVVQVLFLEQTRAPGTGNQKSPNKDEIKETSVKRRGFREAGESSEENAGKAVENTGKAAAVARPEKETRTKKHQGGMPTPPVPERMALKKKVKEIEREREVIEEEGLGSRLESKKNESKGRLGHPHKSGDKYD